MGKSEPDNVLLLAREGSRHIKSEWLCLVLLRERKETNRSASTEGWMRAIDEREKEREEERENRKIQRKGK